MSSRAEIEIRFNKILESRASSLDFDRLFTWVRDQDDATESLREVGHFTAHWAVRSRGIAWQQANRFCDYLDFYTSCVHNGSSAQAMAEFIRKCLHLEKEKDLQRKFEIKKSDIEMALNQIIAKVESIDGSNFFKLDLTGEFYENEINLMNECFSIDYIIFNLTQMFEEISSLLKNLSLVNERNVHLFISKKKLFHAYILSRMHNVEIERPDGNNVKLRLGQDASKNLAIYSEFKHWRKEWDRHAIEPVTLCFISCPSECAAVDWCELDFTQEPRPESPLELNDDGKIVKVA